MARRLLVISSGSWDVSVLGRNALDRLLAARAGGFFEEVDYVFFPAGVRGQHEPEPNFRVYEIPGRDDPERASGWWSRARGLREGWREIREIADSHPPAIVNAVEPFLSGALAIAIAQRQRIPMVSTVVSNYRLSWEVGELNPIPFLPAPLSFTVERRVLGAASRIHADCDHYAEYAIQRGAVSSRVRRIPRYADPIFYEHDPDPDIWMKLQVPDSYPLVYVGRLSPEKYAMELAEAFLMVLARRSKTHLVVLGGGGSQEDRFLESIREAGSGESVHIRRGLSREEILSAMGWAGVLVAPHAGYALLEAALAGAPVVAYDYEWHPELIREGETGRLVPYRDTQALAAAALILLRDRDKAQTLGSRLRDLARSRHRREHHTAALRESYLDLLQ